MTSDTLTGRTQEAEITEPAERPSLLDFSSNLLCRQSRAQNKLASTRSQGCRPLRSLRWVLQVIAQNHYIPEILETVCSAQSSASNRRLTSQN